MSARDHPGIDPSQAWRPVLDWLDVLIERETLRLRARYELSLDELRGVYVSDEQVDALLREGRTTPKDDPVAALTASARARAPDLARHPMLAPWADRLAIEPALLDVLALALAPEIDLRYETLYAYLNNDVTRRHLTVDLALRLLRDARPGTVPQRRWFARAAPLSAQGAIEWLAEAGPRSSLQHGFVIAPLLGQMLVGQPLEDPRWPAGLCWLPPSDDTPIDDVDRDRFERADRSRLVLVSGGDAADRSRLVRRWAKAGARPALHVPITAFSASTDADTDTDRSEACMRSVLLAARITNAVVLCEDDDALDAAARARAWAMIDRLGASTGRAAVVAATPQSWASRMDLVPSLAIELAASARAADEALGRLATRVVDGHDWSHIVLPDNTLRQLHEIADAVGHRDRVYRAWGMQARTGRSAGLAVLFTGASGTGKTMAASVVAKSAGLPLYRVDLALVVSKYIGETEQNLGRIFRAARGCNAVLLFDEADALLGKRSEVKDAHDRYANLEVAYLLQQLESHDGVVILASNLPKNLDAAFTRRIHFSLEFGRPNALLRERLWRGMFGPGVPLADDIDWRFLAEKFESTGGEIQAIALDAAFLAAAEFASVGMPQLMRAMTRRQTRQGNAGGLARFEAHRASRPDPVAEPGIDDGRIEP